MPVNLPQLLGRKATDEEIAVMASAFAQTPGENPGLFVPLTRRDVAEIYRAANERE
jgi:hypothetical protein